MQPSGEALPPPRFELPPQGPENGVDNARERVQEAETGSESAAGKQQPQLPPPQTTTVNPPPAAQLPVAKPAATQPPLVTQDLSAQDVDLIEKSWVHRMKKVIDSTKNDPFKQKDEVSRVKADYVKKRFNKVIPTDDAVKA